MLHDIRRLDPNHLWQIRASACTTHKIAVSTVNTRMLKGDMPTRKSRRIVPIPRTSKQKMLQRGGDNGGNNKRSTPEMIDSQRTESVG